MLGDGIRRDFSRISQEEQTLFVNALRKLDDPASVFVYPNNLGHEGADASGNITYWDMQEQIHKDAHAHGINVHVGPAFIPWHRVIVNRLEALLRQVDPRLSLHYWDWTTDPRVAIADRVSLFTHACLGDDGHESLNRVPADGGGDAGVPFQDFETTEGGGHNFIWRNVGAAAANPDGTPALASDSKILSNTNFTDFATALKAAHDDVAHSYVGGTLTDAHFSFHDPFVFLLHSNLDRIWATWQREPGHPERLDPATAYGTIATDEGEPANYFDEWVQPWSGVDSNGAVQTDLNPWKSDPSQQAHVPYNDPSVVIPASYDTAVHSAYIIVNRDTFSNAEVTAKGTPATFQNAFSVIFDGFTPKELGATSSPLPNPPPKLPAFAFSGVANITAINPKASYENPTGTIDMPQRIMISYDLQFANANDFPPAAGGENFVGLQATLNYNVDTGTGGTVVPQTAVASTELVLVNQPDPYMVDTQWGDSSPYWLSVDTRVLQVKAGDTIGAGAAGSNGPATQSDMDSDGNAPFKFIQQVMANFNSLPNDLSHPFLTQLSEDENASQLELSQKVGGQRVYNYAVAKVRYLAPATVDATNVSAFFRLFNTAVSALDYDGTGVATIGNYRRSNNTNGSSVPLLGIENDSQGQPETSCIPFFASPRVDTSTQKMTDQPPDNVEFLPGASFPHTNIQTIKGTGSENVAYFGAWLDINLAPGDPNFRRLPLSQSGVSGWPDGPYSGSLPSLQQLMLGTHHCMVVEVFFWPPGTTGDPIPHAASPASSDRLAQRNLALVKSGNPGFPATHSVQHTFVVKPAVRTFDRRLVAARQAIAARAAAASDKSAKRAAAADAKTAAAIVTRGYRGPDELIVRWNNVPRNAEAMFYMPEIQADDILNLSALRQHPTVLEKVDAHTLRCRLSDVTFIPLPSRNGTIAGLLSLTLPQGVRAGQVFRFSVEQYSGYTLRTLGAFQMTIPVKPDAEILPEEIRKLSVMRYIQQAIPPTSRWYSVFIRYLDQIAGRVRGFGGDPDTVKPSPDGGEGAPPVRHPHYPKEDRPSDLFCLNIPWKECEIEGELDLKLRFKRRCN
jgi:tyrosinase-like protein